MKACWVIVDGIWLDALVLISLMETARLVQTLDLNTSLLTVRTAWSSRGMIHIADMRIPHTLTRQSR